MANHLFRPSRRDILLVLSSFLLAYILVGSGSHSPPPPSSSTTNSPRAYADTTSSKMIHGVKKPDPNKYGGPSDYDTIFSEDEDYRDPTALPNGNHASSSNPISHWSGKLASPFLSGGRFGDLPILSALGKMGGTWSNGWLSSKHTFSENLAMEEALEAAVCDVAPGAGFGTGERMEVTFSESVRRVSSMRFTFRACFIRRPFRVCQLTRVIFLSNIVNLLLHRICSYPSLSSPPTPPSPFHSIPSPLLQLKQTNKNSTK